MDARMLVGAHESVAGGVHLSLERALADGCRALQIFTKNANQWREPTPTADGIAFFKSAREKFGDGKILSHTSYLINLATDREDLLEKSVDSLAAEVMRSSALGVDYCVLHPGAHLGLGAEAGLKRAAAALDEVHKRTEGATARILIENTAGQGTCVGCSFPEVHQIFDQVKHPELLGVCLDTQHSFASGYDLSTAEGYAKTFDEFDREIGITRLLAFHLNDSKKALGSRVDRHENIGEGILGLPLFWRLVNDPRFAKIPGVLETEPKNPEHPYRDEVGLLNRLVNAPEPPKKEPTFSLELSPAPPKTERKKKS
jgi:deoxyribonuclease-4